MDNAKPVPDDGDWVLPQSLLCPTEWTDYNGHMNVAYYARAFDIATTAFLASELQASDLATIAPLALLKCRIDYHREVLLGTALAVHIRLLTPPQADTVSIASYMTATPENGGESYLAATEEREFRRCAGPTPGN